MKKGKSTNVSSATLILVCMFFIPPKKIKELFTINAVSSKKHHSLLATDPKHGQLLTSSLFI